MIGIYAIYWWDQDKVYIGQTQNFSKRKSQHLSDLESNRHKNYKLQNIYNKYGVPDIFIIQECDISSLDFLEKLWIDEFNAIKTGLNIAAAGTTIDKIITPNSKYTKLKILLTFRILYNSISTYREIAKKLDVDKNLPYRIYSGNHYIWLKEKYPYLYNKMYKLRYIIQ